MEVEMCKYIFITLSKKPGAMKCENNQPDESRDKVVIEQTARKNSWRGVRRAIWIHS